MRVAGPVGRPGGGALRRRRGRGLAAAAAAGSARSAVLVRAGFQTRAFEERFIQLGLPYRVIGGPALLRAGRDPRRDRLFPRSSASRTTIWPSSGSSTCRARGIGDSDAAQRCARRRARGRGQPGRRRRATLCQTDELPARARNALRRAARRLRPLARQLARRRPPRELAEIVLDECGLHRDVAGRALARRAGPAGEPEGAGQGGAGVRHAAGFLEHVSLVMENAADPDADMVSIMTLHGAKGLEFDNVFLAGWEEGLFPNQRAIDEGGTKALEEERRLAYVGITRARRRLHHQLRRQPPGLQSVVVERAVALRRGAAGRAYRAPAPQPGHAPRPRHLPRRRAVRAPPASRFRSRRAELGKLIEGRAEILTSRGPPARAGSFKVGDRIFHDKFGYGLVRGGRGQQARHRVREGRAARR